MSNTTAKYEKVVVHEHDESGKYIGYHWEMRCEGKTVAVFPDADTGVYYANLLIGACKADDAACAAEASNVK